MRITHSNYLKLLVLGSSLTVCFAAIVCPISLAQEDDPFAEPSPKPEVQENPFAEQTAHDAGTYDAAFHEAVVKAQRRWKKKQQQLRLLLEEPTTVEFFEQTLDEIMDHFSEKHKLHFQIDVVALDTLGLDSSLPISLTANDVALRQALEMMLAPNDLTYVAREGVLTVTSNEEAEEMLSTKLYPVGELLNPQQPNESMNQLTRLVTSTIDPDTWSQVGGPGSICSYQGTLAISQTDGNHEQIHHLLGGLGSAIRAAGGPNIPVEEKTETRRGSQPRRHLQPNNRAK